jgi:DNA primase
MVMLKESQLFSLLDKVLNQTSYIRKDEEAVFYCPFCSHHKKKLEVNVRSQKWHCWICNMAGQSIESLFYKIKARGVDFDELYKIVGREWKRPDEAERIYDLTLPDEFIPLWKKEGDYGRAMAYLTDRGVTVDDILRYNIGYCCYGEYENRIVIPSFDDSGNINFFSARTYNEIERYRYMLSPWSKNIIGFDLLINWNQGYITVTEGTFDAMAIRNNAIPLFGTILSDKLKAKIIQSQIKRVNVALDSDTPGVEGALRIYEFLHGLGIDVHLIMLNDKDPATIGFQEMTKIIEKSKPTSFSDIIKIKLSYL